MNWLSSLSAIIARTVLGLTRTLCTADICAHARTAAEPGQPQHRPECVIILDAEGTVTFLCVVSPQVACVERCTVRTKVRNFNFNRTLCKPASYHVRPNSQGPPLPLHVCNKE